MYKEKNQQKLRGEKDKEKKTTKLNLYFLVKQFKNKLFCTGISNRKLTFEQTHKTTVQF